MRMSNGERLDLSRASEDRSLGVQPCSKDVQSRARDPIRWTCGPGRAAPENNRPWRATSASR